MADPEYVDDSDTSEYFYDSDRSSEQNADPWGLDPFDRVTAMYDESREYDMIELDDDELSNLVKGYISDLTIEEKRENPAVPFLQLWAEDDEQLEASSHRTIRLDHPFLQGLVETLRNELRVYTDHLLPHSPESPSMQEQQPSIDAHRDLQQLPALITEHGLEQTYADVLLILESYNQAWNKNYIFLTRRFEDIVAMDRLYTDQSHWLEGDHGQWSEDLKALKDKMNTGILIYKLLLRPEIIRFQEHDDFVKTHEEILDLVARVPETYWIDEPNAKAILDTYMNAWEGWITPRGRVVVVPLVEMEDFEFPDIQSYYCAFRDR